MDKQRAVFFDIDGTLWDFQSHIPDSTIDAIRRLRKNGHLAFLNSGRSRGFIIDENLLGIGFDGIVSGCGCMIEYQGKTLFQYSLPQDLLRRAMDIFTRHGFRMILEGHSLLYLDRQEFGKDPYGQKLMADLGDSLLDIYGPGPFDGICKFSCIMNKEEIGACVQELSPWFYAILHNEVVGEFVPLGYTKASGMQRVLEHLGLSVSQSVAFGDSINDMQMIRAAGIGVAMGNGVEALKKAATLVTAPMKEDGIQKALEGLGLI